MHADPEYSPASPICPDCPENSTNEPNCPNYPEYSPTSPLVDYNSDDETCESETSQNTEDMDTDPDYVDVDGLSEGSEIDNEEPVVDENMAHLKSTMEKNFKKIKTSFKNFEMLHKTLNENKKNMTSAQLAMGHYLPLDLKIQMVEKGMIKMADCVSQTKDIAMDDVMTIVMTGEGLKDMKLVREYLETEYETLEKWSMDRLNDLEERIKYFNRNIAKIVKSEVFERRDDKLRELRARYPLFELARCGSNDTLCSDGHTGECLPMKYILAKYKKLKMDHKRAVAAGRLKCDQCIDSVRSHPGRMCEVLLQLERYRIDEIDEHKLLSVTGHFECTQCALAEFDTLKDSDMSGDSTEATHNGNQALNDDPAVDGDPALDGGPVHDDSPTLDGVTDAALGDGTEMLRDDVMDA